MQRFEYKGRVVDVFTTRKGDTWTWALTIDGIKAAINRNPNCCTTSELAVAQAKDMACALIDLEE